MVCAGAGAGRRWGGGGLLRGVWRCGWLAWFGVRLGAWWIGKTNASGDGV